MTDAPAGWNPLWKPVLKGPFDVVEYLHELEDGSRIITGKSEHFYQTLLAMAMTTNPGEPVYTEAKKAKCLGWRLL